MKKAKLDISIFLLFPNFSNVCTFDWCDTLGRELRNVWYKQSLNRSFVLVRKVVWNKLHFQITFKVFCDEDLEYMVL